MRYELSKVNLELSETVNKALAHKMEKVEQRLKRYHPDVADLDIRLEYHEKQKSHECSLNLKAFKDSLHARKSAPELRSAIDLSFDALIRELDSYRNKVNKSLQASH